MIREGEADGQRRRAAASITAARTTNTQTPNRTSRNTGLSPQHTQHSNATQDTTHPLPVEPKVSIAKNSPSSMRVASPPFTIGTLLPAWIWYGAMLCPFRLRTH